jgi:hypothetical protein
MERFLKKIAISLIGFYQKAISPFFPSSCRYTPSCSEYAKQALAKYGILRGTAKTLSRLFRCHPWGGSGFDPP